VSRSNRGKTMKAVKHTEYTESRARKQQLLIAAMLVQEQVAELQAAGVLPPPAPVAAAAAAAVPDPLEQELNLDEAVLVLQNVAAQAADPEPLIQQINAQAANTIRSGCLRRYTVKNVISILMTLVAMYYSSFPLHAAPRETSVFDAIAGHLSTAGTASSLASLVGLASLPASGTLAACAFGVKAAGKMVRNYNAATGRFPNTEEEALRRRINLGNYAPGVGTAQSLTRFGGIAARSAFNYATGTPLTVGKLKKNFGKSTANVAVNVGGLVGAPPEKALSAVEKAGAKAAALLM
jgi:hypothetical protein